MRKFGVAGALLVAATVARFTSMNSSMDMVTPLLLMMTLSVGFFPGMVLWLAYGVIEEISFAVQGSMAIFSPMQFLVPVLTCVTIGLFQYGYKTIFGKDGFMLALPLVGFVSKVLLTTMQDVWLLVFKPSILPVWGLYFISSVTWALPKFVQAFVWTVPVWVVYHMWVLSKNKSKRVLLESVV